MRPGLELTADERHALEEVVAQLDSPSGESPSWNGLRTEWETFVTAIERGYDDSIYEYTNDLSVRDRLARVVEGAPTTLRRKLEQALAPIDRRFTDATEEADRPLTAAANDPGPWWRRMPARRQGELADDLEALGVNRRREP